MSKIFEIMIHIPVKVILQDEEYQEIVADATRRRDGTETLDEVIMALIQEQAQHTAINFLQYNRSQYNGALIAVIGKGAD